MPFRRASILVAESILGQVLEIDPNKRSSRVWLSHEFLSKTSDDEDEEVKEVTDRAYWEKRASKTTLGMTHELFGQLKSISPDLELKYNKFYIGLAKNGQPSTFVLFRPKKEWLRLEIALDRTDELDSRLEASGVDVMDYDTRWGKYRLRLGKDDLKKNRELVNELMAEAYGRAFS
jgi:predicted transport protein